MTRRIAIIGAGAAGLSTAIALAARGIESTLFEKHVSPTSRGAGLLIQPAGVNALGQLGVGRAFDAASTPIARLLGKSHRMRTVVDVTYQGDVARAVSRHELSRILTEKALSVGVELRFSSPIVDFAVRPLGVELSSDMGGEVFDALVIDDGADSGLRLKAGLDIASTPYPWGALWGLFEVDNWTYPQTLVQRYRGTRRMFGLMPTSVTDRRTILSFFWSVKLADAGQWFHSDLAVFRRELLDLWPESAPVVEQIRRHSRLSLARYQHAWPRRLGVPRVYVAGDCAHSMSPSLGLGTTLATQDALAIAKSFAECGGVEGPGIYSRQRLRHIQYYQQLSRLLTPCFQGDRGGALRDVFFGIAASLPPTRWLMRRSLAT